MKYLHLTRRDAGRLGAAAALLLATRTAAWAAPDSSADSARLARLADEFYRRNYTLFPLDATEAMGDPAFEAMLEIDIAPAHRARQRALAQWVLAGLAKIDPAKLQGQDVVTWKLFEFEAKERLALMDVPWHLTPVLQVGSLPVRLAEWASGQGPQPLRTTANYEHFLARLKKIPAWIAQAIRNMDEGIAKGITLPRPLVERTLPQYDELLTADPELSPYLAAIREFPDTVAQNDRARIARAYRETVAREVTPAVRRLRDYLANRYLPNARTTAGWGALPNGQAWYAQLVRSSTTTELTPQQVHERGLREVARIHGEMEQVKARFRYEGTLREFLQSFASRPEVKPFRTEADVLQAYAALNEKIKAGLPALFERAPRAELQIKAVPPTSAATASDNYTPPAADGSRPGIFWAVITDPAQYETTRMTSLFLHEGQPGHHYQIALQQELPIPRMRRGMWFDAFGEGWGLYAEGLGNELGLYKDDPTAYLGRLLMELHRAIRLVVDTGLHALGWTRERTIAYIMRAEGTTEESARRATERYMSWPGQATAYKIGELKLLELRERARRRLGSRFDLRVFHTRVLEDGCVPLSMLEAKIDAWLAQAA